MENIPIIHNGNRVGTGTISSAGLYYRISCKCRLQENEICEIVLNSRGVDYNVGICIPEKGFFLARKQIQKKLIDPSDISLVVTQRNRKTEILIDPSNPFPHLEQLQYAKLLAADHRYIHFDSKDGYSTVR